MTLMRFLFRYIRPYGFAYFFGIIGMGAVNLVLNVYLASILGSITSSMIRFDQSLLIQSIMHILWLLLGGGLLLWFSAITLVHSEIKVERDLRSDLFGKILTIPLRRFESLTSGEILSRFNNDLSETSQLLKNSLQSLATVLFYGAGSCVVVLILDWFMGLLIIGLALLFFVLNLPFLKPLQNQSQMIQELKASFLNTFNQLVTGQTVLRHFNIADWMMNRIVKSSRLLRSAGIRRNTTETLRFSFENVSYWSVVLLVVVGGFRAIDDPTYLPTLVALIQMQNGVSFFFTRISLVISEIQRRFSGVDRIREMIEAPDEPKRFLMEGSPSTPAPVSDADGGLLVEDLSFSYSEGAGPTLRGIDFRVPEGKTAAFVGPSGSGKSTLFKLLLGLYPFRSGAIRYRGQSIDSLPLDQWRAYFSYVPQLPYLFSGSIRDNLVAVNPNIGEEEIGKVIDSANAAEFIQELDQGVDSELLEGGLNLSGGQRQRVVLSRAFLEDAPILLLDEATSALDTESERAVQEALSRLSEGRTTLVIAHRLSTVRKADVLFFLEAGAIVESGSHQELMKIPNGKYRQMVEAGILKNDSE